MEEAAHVKDPPKDGKTTLETLRLLERSLVRVALLSGTTKRMLPTLLIHSQLLKSLRHGQTEVGFRFGTLRKRYYSFCISMLIMDVYMWPELSN
jgi:hypothetical protein